MVIRTEYRSTRYSMGSLDPLPAGFEIWFGSLIFQATGNGYLMRLTNREELRAQRQAGSAPVPAGAPPQRRHPQARMLRARQRHGAAAAPASVHDRRGPSGGKLNVPPPNTAHPSGRRPPPRQGSARSPDHASPSVCAVPRQPTTPTSTPRCAGFPLAVTSSSPGTPAPPPAMSRPWAPTTRCHPPTYMGTRSGMFPAYRTR
jgi:hypothetical protein